VASKCPVCGLVMGDNNKFCSLACYKSVSIPEITKNFYLGGDSE